MKVDIKEYNFDFGHKFLKCGCLLDEAVCLTFDPYEETIIPKDVKMPPLWTAKYWLSIIRKSNLS